MLLLLSLATTAVIAVFLLWKVSHSIVLFYIFYSFFLCTLLLSPFFLSPSIFWDERKAISCSLLFQSQSVADPSSERDYPSISISHTLISHVSLQKLCVSNFTSRVERLLIIGGLRGFSVHREHNILKVVSRLKQNAFHRLLHDVSTFIAAVTP